MKYTNYLTPIICLFILVSIVSSGSMVDWLSLDRNASEISLSWRWLTAHFTHFNIRHLFLNLSGLAVIFYINDRLFRSWRGLLCTLALCLWISAGIWFLNPETVRYAGLSGLLHGLVIIAAATTNHYNRWIKVAMMIIWTGKTLREQTSFYDSGFMMNFLGTGVAVDAHLYGLIGGYLLLLIISIKKASQTREASQSQ